MIALNGLTFYGLIALISFVLTVVTGAIILPILRRKKSGSQERDYGLDSHLKKSGTPIFGGLFFLIPIALMGLYFGIAYRQVAIIITTVFILGSAAIGFADDYTKITKGSDGISPKQKTLGLMVVIALYLVYVLWKDPFIVLPFGGQVVTVTGIWKVVYGLFLVIFLYGVVNAVNLTDGVDGLLSLVTVPVTVGQLAVSFILAHLHEGPEAANGALFSAIMLGGCLGFFVYNHHKAKVFMGDTGSLAIGAMISAVAILQGVPWILLLFGIIYVVEALSVIIQVTYFRKTGGKRIFRMSPIHHHYEKGGWSEWKVVVVFSLVSLLGCGLGILTLL